MEATKIFPTSLEDDLITSLKTAEPGNIKEDGFIGIDSDSIKGSHIGQGTVVHKVNTPEIGVLNLKAQDSFDTSTITEDSKLPSASNKDIDHPSLVAPRARGFKSKGLPISTSGNKASPFDQAALDNTFFLPGDEHSFGDSKADQHGVEESTDVIEYSDMVLANDQYSFLDKEVRFVCPRHCVL